MKKSNALALIPIGVFIVFYLCLGIVFEYVMKIPMGFYSVPVVVAFLLAILVAVLQTRGISLEKKFEIMGHGVGDKNIITMLLIFMLAGIFVGVVGRSSAESVAYFRVTGAIRTRRKASLFSAFWLLLLARHQALLRPPHQKSLENPRLFGRRISVEQIFSAGRKGAQRILDIFSSSLTNLRCKFADPNRVRMTSVTLG